MWQHMVPWTRGLIPYLSRHAKLCEMQQDAHTLVQLIYTMTPNIPNPNATNDKIIAQSLPYTTHAHHCMTIGNHSNSHFFAQPQIPKWDYDMHPTLVGPIMATHLKIKQFPSCAQHTIAILCEHIC